jgi:hypothetical protein
MANIDPVIAELLKSQGRLEAQVAMLMADEMAEMECEDEDEDESEPLLTTNPATTSNMLEFDIPPIF